MTTTAAATPAPLTTRQAAVLAELQRYQAAHGVMPTLQELATALGLRAAATVHKHLEALKAKGYVDRRWNRSRATTIVPPETPEGLAEAFAAGWAAAVEAGRVDCASAMVAARAHWLEAWS